MLVEETGYIDPALQAGRLAGAGEFSFLDSSMHHPGLGRYSWAAADPFEVFRVAGGSGKGEPLAELRQRLLRYRSAAVPGLPPFQGGAIGYIAYDFGATLEKLDRPDAERRICDDMRFAFYDVVLAWDHVERRCWIMSSGFPETEPQARRSRAQARLEEFRHRLAAPADEMMRARPPFRMEEQFQP